MYTVTFFPLASCASVLLLSKRHTGPKSVPPLPSFGLLTSLKHLFFFSSFLVNFLFCHVEILGLYSLYQKGSMNPKLGKTKTKNHQTLQWTISVLVQNQSMNCQTLKITALRKENQQRQTLWKLGVQNSLLSFALKIYMEKDPSYSHL